MQDKEKSIIEDILASVGLEPLTPARRQGAHPILAKRKTDIPHFSLARQNKFGARAGGQPCFRKDARVLDYIGIAPGRIMDHPAPENN